MRSSTLAIFHCAMPNVTCRSIHFRTPSTFYDFVDKRRPNFLWISFDVTITISFAISLPSRSARRSPFAHWRLTTARTMIDARFYEYMQSERTHGTVGEWVRLTSGLCPSQLTRNFWSNIWMTNIRCAIPCVEAAIKKCAIQMHISDKSRLRWRFVGVFFSFSLLLRIKIQTNLIRDSLLFK